MGQAHGWIKLQDNFFEDVRISLLRKLAGGDTYTIIYLKMQLLSLKNDGLLKFENVESTFPKEIALEIDENSESVKAVLMYLESVGLIETLDAETIRVCLKK